MTNRKPCFIIRKSNWSQVASALLETGNQIERLRIGLGFTEPFGPLKRYLEYREMKGSNMPGEPTLAKQFLEELGEA